MAMTNAERLAYKRMIYHSARRKLIGMLGGQCVKCGVATDDLELDHINNDGKADRAKHGKGTYMLKYHIENPDIAKKTLQVMCKSCHREKHGRNWWE